MRLLLLSLVLLAWSAGPVVTPKSAAPPQPAAPALDIAAAEAEFDALHAQARDALERLRQAREQRLAMTAPATL